MSKEKAVELQTLRDLYITKSELLNKEYENERRKIEEKYDKWKPAHTLALNVYGANGFIAANNMETQVKKFFKMLSYIYENTNVENGVIEFESTDTKGIMSVAYVFYLPQEEASVLEKRIQNGNVVI